MFGLDLTELILLLIVGIVVVGPKKLPQMMRTTGQWVAKLRRMSSDLRSQSGIDAILRAEGLEKELRELRSLSRINVMDSLVNATTRPAPRALPAKSTSAGGATVPAAAPAPPPVPAVAASSEGPAPGSASVPPSPGAAAGPGVASGSVALPIAPPGASPPGSIAATPPGVVARATAMSATVTAPTVLPGDEPLAEREWPPWGCDAYEALPDDLEEEEQAADEAPALGEPPAAETEPPAAEAEPGAA